MAAVSPPSNAALLLVDIQRDFWTNLDAVRESFPDLPRNVARILQVSRASSGKVIAVHVRAEYNASVSGRWLPWYKALDDLERSENVSPEPEPWSTEQPGEPVIIKHTFDGFLETKLDETLRGLGVKRIYVCGLLTNCCVLATAMGAFYRGYEVCVIAECCGDRLLERHDWVIRNYNYIWKAVSIDDVEAALAQEAS